MRLVLILLLATNLAAGQTGGPYDLKHSVIAGGGGNNSSNGVLSVGGTVGQGFAGITSNGSGYSLRSGFWGTESFAPTSANVSIRGRAVTSLGGGIRNVAVVLTDARGGERTTFTGSFGYFRFDDVMVGQTYIIEVRNKRFMFFDPVRAIYLEDELTDVDFIAKDK